MLQKYNKWLVLRVFFDNPNPQEAGFQLRELGRKVRLAPISVKRYLSELVREGLIIKARHRIHKYPVYWANRASDKFRFLKKIDTVLQIKESGLLDYLWENLTPDTIVLFGSASWGEDVLGSDIDIFVQCKQKHLNLDKFEKKLNRKISPFFGEDFGKLSQELKNNIINGTILAGYLKVF